MAASNPMQNTYSVSKKSFAIAGILTTVYGLEELSEDIKNVACLWLLHPRLQTQACMEPLAVSNINGWNLRRGQRKKNELNIGLVAVSFDQRNHGSREVNELANETWRSGNARHAQDMFSIYHGTSMDVSLLITYISSYIFPKSNYTITTHFVCGVSLGGHSAWQCVLHDSRITAAIVVIGCPDYFNLMLDRARLSNIRIRTHSSHSGEGILNSEDFPPGLVEAVEKYDPAALLVGPLWTRNDTDYYEKPSTLELETLMPKMKSLLQGKRILNLSGEADKVVPYRCTHPFMCWLREATSPDGWFSDGGLMVEDIVYEGVGHEMTSKMADEVVRFVGEGLGDTAIEVSRRESKI